VGRRFNDHPQVVLGWTPSRDFGREATDWISGCLNFRSADGPISGDLQILQSNVPMSMLTGHPSASQVALPLLISANWHTPTGSLRMVSADPRAPLDIQYQYLSTSADQARLRHAVRTAFELLSTKPFDAISAGPRDLDRRTIGNNRLLNRWIHERLGTTLHACGTAAMGSGDNPDAVVDQFGTVHGIDGLRIADTSILPTAPLRGPAATAVLIGEVIANAIRGTSQTSLLR